jgi:death on curing protein
MGCAGSEIVYPSEEQICYVNRRMIQTSGGLFVPPDNLIDRASLSYILDAITAPVFGREMYPSLIDKAAALLFYIISRHVFFDGNKRTAAYIAWEFLNANGCSVSLDTSVVELAENIAADRAGYAQAVTWIIKHRW